MSSVAALVAWRLGDGDGQLWQGDGQGAQFGYLRDSTDALADTGELRRRIAAGGYLFIAG